jgi:hypothetical protein
VIVSTCFLFFIFQSNPIIELGNTRSVVSFLLDLSGVARATRMIEQEVLYSLLFSLYTTLRWPSTGKFCMNTGMVGGIC